MTVTLYHNPNCGTSRTVLATLKERGIEPRVVEYLKTPLSREELDALVRRMGVPVRDLMRRKGTRYDELGLDDPKWTDEALIGLMAEDPALINRPIVVTERGAALCRPAERVFSLLPQTVS